MWFFGVFDTFKMLKNKGVLADCLFLGVFVLILKS
jgi:hypothetical protein